MLSHIQRALLQSGARLVGRAISKNEPDSSFSMAFPIFCVVGFVAFPVIVQKSSGDSVLFVIGIIGSVLCVPVGGLMIAMLLMVLAEVAVERVFGDVDRSCLTTLLLVPVRLGLFIFLLCLPFMGLFEFLDLIKHLP